MGLIEKSMLERWEIEWIEARLDKAKSIKQQKVCCTSNITDDKAQTIDAEPVRHGRWVDVKFSEGVFKDNDDSDDIGISITSAKCSLCQRYSEQLQQYSPHMPAYCSHCGAKMDLKDGESK